MPVRGDLELHGVTQAVDGTLEGRWTGDRIDVVGVLPIQLADYGIETPNNAVVTTEDNGEVELKLVFRRA